MSTLPLKTITISDLGNTYTIPGDVSDAIASEFSTSSTYAVGDYVLYNDNLYRCTTAITTAGTWDENDWQETSAVEVLENIVSDVGDISELNTTSKNNLVAAINETYALAATTDTTLSVSGMAADAKATGDELSDLREDLNNAQDRLSVIDNKAYVPLEIGYVASDANGFTYSEVDYRVRTKKGFTIELKEGDRVGLRDYIGKRYILSRYDYTTETYKGSGWLTTDWTVTSQTEGLYVIMIAYNPDSTISNIDDLTDLFYLVKKPHIGTPLSIMSFNIGHFAYGQVGVGTQYKWGIADSIYSDRLSNWKNFFIKYYPEVLCLQEYSRCLDRVADGETDADGTVDTDATIFDKMYDNKMPCQTSGNAFIDTRGFTNITLDDTTSVQVGSGGLYCTYSHITKDGKKIAVINFHASTTPTARASEFNAIKTLVQDDEYVIIAGDFNADISEFAVFVNSGYKVINGAIESKQATYNSVISYYCGQDETAKLSWYDFDKRVYERTTRNLFIDNIIVSNNIDILSFNVCGGDFENLTSDHCAIIAELSVK